MKRSGHTTRYSFTRDVSTANCRLFRRVFTFSFPIMRVCQPNFQSGVPGHR